MKKMINNINIDQLVKVIYLCIVLLSITGIVHAQIGDPGGSGSGDPDNAPIDGGLSLLIAGGVGYGIKKVKERRKKNSD